MFFVGHGCFLLFLDSSACYYSHCFRFEKIAKCIFFFVVIIFFLIKLKSH